VRRWYVKQDAEGWSKTPVGRRVDPKYEATGYEIVDEGDPRLEAIRAREPGGKEWVEPPDKLALLEARVTAAETKLAALEKAKGIGG